MKRYLISFADSRMLGALERLQAQARELQFFDEIKILTEHDLDITFREKYKNLLRPHVRGFGYWLWKPYIINQVFSTLQHNDELYYLDAGCHINSHGRKRMQEYADTLAASKIGIVAFELEKGCNERAFSKMDLLEHFIVQQCPQITDTGQICATHIFCKKKPESSRFIEEWLNTCYNIHFIDDSPSLSNNFPEFSEHRHDQSVFSILCKLHAVDKLPGNETWPEGGTRDWNTLINYPIWDKRDLGFTSHLISRCIRKIKKILSRYIKAK